MKTTWANQYRGMWFDEFESYWEASRPNCLLEDDSPCAFSHVAEFYFELYQLELGGC